MRLPGAKEVPFTAALSGAVFVAALFSLASPLNELVLFTAWGLVYVVESLIRGAARAREPYSGARRPGRPGAGPSSTDDQPAGADAADRPGPVADVLRYAVAVLGYIGIGAMTKHYLSFTWGLLYFVLVLDVLPRTLRKVRARPATPAAPAATVGAVGEP